MECSFVRLNTVLIALCTIPATAHSQILCGRVETTPPSAFSGPVFVGFAINPDKQRMTDSVQTDSVGRFCLKPKEAGIYAPVLYLDSGERIQLASEPLVAPDSLHVLLTVDLIRLRAKADFGKETPVRLAQPAKMGGYPADLTGVRAEGVVDASYVVNPSGRVNPATIVILRSDDQRFADAVRQGITRMRFHPATIDGRAIHRLVRQQFRFSAPP